MWWILGMMSVIGALAILRYWKELCSIAGRVWDWIASYRAAGEAAPTASPATATPGPALPSADLRTVASQTSRFLGVVVSMLAVLIVVSPVPVFTIAGWVGFLLLLPLWIFQRYLASPILKSDHRRGTQWMCGITTAALLAWTTYQVADYTCGWSARPPAQNIQIQPQPKAEQPPVPRDTEVAQRPLEVTEEVLPDQPAQEAPPPEKKSEPLPGKTESVPLNGTRTPEKKPEAAPAAAQVPPVDSRVLLGTWVGEVEQPGFSPGKYSARVVLRRVQEGAEAGTVEYPSLG